MGTPGQDGGTRAQEARELQRGWYGEPLGDLFRRLIGDLGLNQVRLAGVLGLSAPMLSQLMSGQRAKIGNPAVVQRLQAVQELATDAAEGRVGPAEAAARLDEIRDSETSSVLHTTARARTGKASAREAVRCVQAVLRSVASASEVELAADTLASAHPQLAEFLRVYGAGRTAEAMAHYEAHQD